VIINCSKFGFLNLADQVYEEVLKLVTCETVCIELNYKEVDTPLVKQAKRKGAVVFTGLDFFRKQFVKQFKLLTSFNPPVG
jgi:shikimate 5-dehydrogenase